MAKRRKKKPASLPGPHITFTEREQQEGILLDEDTVACYCDLVCQLAAVKNWSPRMLAEMAGVSTSTARKHIIGGVSRPQVPTVAKILRAFAFELLMVG